MAGNAAAYRTLTAAFQQPHWLHPQCQNYWPCLLSRRALPPCALVPGLRLAANDIAARYHVKHMGGSTANLCEYASMLRSLKLQHAEKLGLVEGGRVAHGCAPCPVITVDIAARTNVVPHAYAVEIGPMLVPTLCSALHGRRAIAAIDQ